MITPDHKKLLKACVNAGRSPEAWAVREGRMISISEDARKKGIQLAQLSHEDAASLAKQYPFDAGKIYLGFIDRASSELPTQKNRSASDILERAT